MNQSSVVLYMTLIANGAPMARGFTGEKPINGVYSWPTERMIFPTSIALLDGISWRDTTS
jgi:hypothetical protein